MTAIPYRESPIPQVIRSMLNFEDVLFKNFFSTESVFDSVFRPKINYNYPVDIYLDNNQLCIDIAAVGLDKKDINLEVKDNILKVSSKKEGKDLPNKIHGGIAKRSFNFGWKFSSKRIKLEKLKAKLDKGLLQIIIPIEKEQKKIDSYKKIEID